MNFPPLPAETPKMHSSQHSCGFQFPPRYRGFVGVFAQFGDEVFRAGPLRFFLESDRISWHSLSPPFTLSHMPGQRVIGAARKPRKLLRGAPPPLSPNLPCRPQRLLRANKNKPPPPPTESPSVLMISKRHSFSFLSELLSYLQVHRESGFAPCWSSLRLAIKSRMNSTLQSLGPRSTRQTQNSPPCANSFYQGLSPPRLSPAFISCY